MVCDLKVLNKSGDYIFLSIFQDENVRSVDNSPTHTMLIISICFPYVLWVIGYTAKSLFGSCAWPSLKTTTVVCQYFKAHT